MNNEGLTKKDKNLIKIAICLCVIGIVVFSLELIKEYNKNNHIEEIIQVSSKGNIDIYPKVYKANLFMVGDMLLHGVVYKDSYVSDNTYDFNNMIEYLKPIVKKSDLAYYNQESIIGGKDLGLSTYPRFNSPDEIGTSMVDIGFNLVGLANNHTLDKGITGIENSIDFWNNQDVVYSGSYLSKEERDDIKIYEINNISYAFLSYTESTNGLTPANDYCVNVYDEKLIKDNISKVKDKVDVIIVAVHWGTEYTTYPTDSQKEKAKFLASQGVDIVIGTHPHVIQPIDYIDDTLVIYSLGNLMSAQDSISTLVGLMANVEIVKTVDNGITDIDISNVTADLHYTHYNNWKDFKIIPFSLLTDDILKDSYIGSYRYNLNSYGSKDKLYKKYSDVVTSLNDDIKMVDMYND